MQPQRRLEESRAGRLALSTFVIVTVTCMVVANLPDKYVPVRRASSVTHHLVDAVGLQQVWRVFSPPRNEVLALEALVTFDDGSETTWYPPRSNVLVGVYHDYHWQKYMEHAALRGNDDGWPRLWEPLARYVAGVERRGGRTPVRVTLITRRTLNLPLGNGGPNRGPEQVVEYFTLDVEPGPVAP